MFEFDFGTEEGKEQAKQYVMELLKNDNKEEIGKLIFSMLEFIVRHEIMFENLKNI